MSWILVEFNCSNGWDKVITSIPESEVSNYDNYLSLEGFRDIQNFKIC
jgi:hypothetical protein